MRACRRAAVNRGARVHQFQFEVCQFAASRGKSGLDFIVGKIEAVLLSQRRDGTEIQGTCAHCGLTLFITVYFAVKCL